MHDKRPGLVELGNEFLFANCVEQLRADSPSGVDIEDGLNDLAQVQPLSPIHAKTILDLARQNIDMWIDKTGQAKTALDALTLTFTVYRNYVRQQNDPTLTQQFTDTSATILAKVIKAQPNSYPDFISGSLRAGVYGHHGPVLAGILKNLYAASDAEGTIWNNRDLDMETSTLASMTDDLLALGDDELTGDIKGSLPATLLAANQDTLSSFPNTVRLLIKDIRKWPTLLPDNFIKLYLFSLARDQKDALGAMRRRIRNGEIHNGPYVLAQAIKTMATEKERFAGIFVSSSDYMIDKAMLDLWDKFSQIEPFRNAFKEVAQDVMSTRGYWGYSDVVARCLASIDFLEIPIGQEAGFIEMYQKNIALVLRVASSQFKDTELTANQKQKLAGYLSWIRQIHQNNPKQGILPDRELVAILS